MLVFGGLSRNPMSDEGQNIFCPSRKNHCSVGVPIDLSTPGDFSLSSTRHRKVVQNPQATERGKWL